MLTDFAFDCLTYSWRNSKVGHARRPEIARKLAADGSPYQIAKFALMVHEIGRDDEQEFIALLKEC